MPHPDISDIAEEIVILAQIRPAEGLTDAAARVEALLRERFGTMFDFAAASDSIDKRSAEIRDRAAARRREFDAAHRKPQKGFKL